MSVSPLAALPFLAPALAVAGAAAVAVPIAIHFLSRMRRRRVDWAATRFLYQAWKKQHRRQQIEHLILLLLRCLMMLLAGLALGGLLLDARGAAAARPGRVVHLVVDDGLTSGAQAGPGRVRLDDLKDQARAVLATLGPADSVALWSAAAPARQLVPPTRDPAAVRAALDALNPGAARPDVPGALAKAAADNPTTEKPVLVLLSDFSRGGLYLEDTPPGDLAGLATRADLLLAEPARDSVNWQVLSVRPRRGTELPAAVAPALGAEVRLRRFGSTDAATCRLRTVLVQPGAAADAEPVVADEREVRFAEGQSELRLSLQLPLPPAARLPAGGLLLRASLRAADGSAPDGLAADDEAGAPVRLCAGAEIGLLDEPAGAGLTAADLLEGNLRALGDNAEFTPRRLLAAGFRAADLEPLTAVFVLRPDLVGAPGWQALRAFALRGGIVWVVAPTQDSTAWADTLRGVFGLPWETGAALETDKNGWPADTGAAPAAFAAITDWAELVRPLRAHRRLAVAAPPEDVWLPFAGAAAGAPRAWLAHRAVGDGELVLLAAPLDFAGDPPASNLAVRQAFVPLVHEGLRAALGLHAPAPPVHAGEQPRLSGGWSALTEITTPDGRALPLLKAEEVAGAVRPAEPLRTPGLWRSADPLRFLAVGPDAAAGDTTQASEVSRRGWFERLGGGRLLPADGRVFDAAPLPPREWTWPLLWALLAVILLECVLARRFSHATTGSPWGVVVDAFRRLKGSER